MKMKNMTNRFRGLTMMEVVVSMALSTIIILGMSVMVSGAQHAWNRSFASTHKQIRQDAETMSITFGKMIRQCNRLDYKLYTVSGSTFTPVTGGVAGQSVRQGDAVEFRYWDVPLTAALLDASRTGTAYALFYMDNGTLKMDTGPYPPGGIPAGGGQRNTGGVTTLVLAHNVSTADGQRAFSHTTQGSTGVGCVRMHVTLTDPDDGDQIRVMTSSLLRNIWPR